MIEFPGPAGVLEGEYFEGAGTDGAVLCHPHPLYGGSMHDRVVMLLDVLLREAGFHTLKFNFRGVGASDGVHDEGEGEVQDVLAAASWLQQQSGCTTPLLAGYSFGAVMALKAATGRGVEHLVLVAPPVLLMKGADLEPGNALVILGESDQIVNHDETHAWFNDRGAQVVSAEGADHFFFGADQKIAEAVRGFVGEIA